MKFQSTSTALPAENEYPKLIRDKIPKIITDHTGRQTVTRVLKDDEEFLRFLLKKVVEEAEELSKSVNDSNVAEEIADIYEVIDALLKFKSISREYVLAVQEKKRNKRGGFEERLLMLKKN